MGEIRFWEIIKLLDWSKSGNDNAVTAPAISKLAEYSLDDVYKFEEILSEKLYSLDCRKYAENIGEESYRDNAYFSVDYFLYIRACVIANGKEYYETVLNAPHEMPKDIDFEPLLYIAQKAYSRKTGSNNFAYMPSYSYETFSNSIGWGNKHKNIRAKLLAS